MPRRGASRRTLSRATNRKVREAAARERERQVGVAEWTAVACYLTVHDVVMELKRPEDANGDLVADFAGRFFTPTERFSSALAERVRGAASDPRYVRELVRSRAATPVKLLQGAGDFAIKSHLWARRSPAYLVVTECIREVVESLGLLPDRPPCRSNYTAFLIHFFYDLIDEAEEACDGAGQSVRELFETKLNSPMVDVRHVPLPYWMRRVKVGGG